MIQRHVTSDGPTRPRVSAPVGATAALIGLVYGYDNGSIASVALFIKPELELSTLALSAIVSAVSAGTLVGAMFGSTVANRMGRKKTLILVATGYLLFSGLQATTVGVTDLIIVRTLLGITIGLSIVCTPAYIAESAPRSRRGAMLVSFNLAQTFGLTSSYFIGSALAGAENWRLILGLAVVPSVVVLFVTLRLSESPRWLLAQDRTDEAMVTLTQIYGNREEAGREAELIASDMRAERGRFREVFQRPMKVAGMFVVVMGFSVQITGIPAVVQYSPTILQNLGFGTPGAILLAIGFVQLVGVVVETIAFLTIDRLGRRPIIMTGMAVMILGHLFLMAAFLSGSSNPVLALIGLMVFIVGFNFGYGALVFVYAAEALPSKLKTHGATALLTANLAANLLISFVFLNLLDAIGGAAAFGGFAVLALLAMAFVYRFAPETKGMPLEAIRTFWLNGARWPTASLKGSLERSGTAHRGTWRGAE